MGTVTSDRCDTIGTQLQKFWNIKLYAFIEVEKHTINLQSWLLNQQLQSIWKLLLCCHWFHQNVCCQVDLDFPDDTNIPTGNGREMKQCLWSCWQASFVRELCKYDKHVFFFLTVTLCKRKRSAFRRWLLLILHVYWCNTCLMKSACSCQGSSFIPSETDVYNAVLGEVFLMRNRKGFTSNVLSFPNSFWNTAEK